MYHVTYKTPSDAAESTRVLIGSAGSDCACNA
jgi:hypothetical protein